jgi:hypothetical protein
MKLKSFALGLGFAVLACVSTFAQTSYNFQTINYPHDTFTQLLGINVSGEIAGYHNDNKGFTYKLSTKKFTNENFPGSTATQVIGINGFGGTCGFYVDQAGVTQDCSLLRLWRNGVHNSRSGTSPAEGTQRGVYGCIIGRSVGGVSGNSLTNCLPWHTASTAAKRFARSLRLNNVTHRARAESFFDYIGG